MEHQHLLPDDFEDLLDGDESEAASAHREHLDRCAECRAEWAKRNQLTRALDQLPHHGPAPLFAYRVMSHVQVFEPWHIALRDSVRRLIPRSSGARWAAAATAIFIATAMTVGGVWVALNGEKAFLFADVGVRRARTAFLNMTRAMLESVFGRDALHAIEGTGTTGAAIAISAIVAVVLIAAVGFRVAALASRRRRS